SASAGSTATNTGDTGDATSIAISNPFAASGVSGGAGTSGATAATPTATNSAPLGSAVAGSSSSAPTSGNGNQAASNQTSAGTGSAVGGVVTAAEASADGLRAADAALANAAELGQPPAFQPPEAPPTPVVPSGGIDGSLAAFSRTLVSEYTEAGATHLLVLFLGFLLAVKIAREFLRLQLYWDLRA
ncbi:MAG TPA: hypothetical protein VF244_00275, partial [Acidimicrobiales bacterium]